MRNNWVPLKGIYRGYIGVYKGIWGLGFGVQVPNDEVLGFWVIAISVQVLGKYMSIMYLDS